VSGFREAAEKIFPQQKKRERESIHYSSARVSTANICDKITMTFVKECEKGKREKKTGGKYRMGTSNSSKKKRRNRYRKLNVGFNFFVKEKKNRIQMTREGNVFSGKKRGVGGTMHQKETTEASKICSRLKCGVKSRELQCSKGRTDIRTMNLGEDRRVGANKQQHAEHAKKPMAKLRCKGTVGVGGHMELSKERIHDKNVLRETWRSQHSSEFGPIV